MMSKERLEELLDDLPYTIRHSGELEPLKQFAKEQAERVQELEDEYKVRRVEYFEEHINRLEQQNQRYKQDLEFYADRSIYNFETETDFDAEETRIINEGHIFRDFGERARKSLKGESE